MKLNDEMYVNIIGAGLAGCECAYILSKNGIRVKLYEMKPNKKSEAHKSNNFAELVCSNSLKSDLLTNACGLLKYEMNALKDHKRYGAEPCVNLVYEEIKKWEAHQNA